MSISRCFSVSKTLVITAMGLLWCCLLSSAQAQYFDPRIPSPNPKLNPTSRRSNRTKKPSREEAKRQVIDDAIYKAITAGNMARDESEFEKALISYRKVEEEFGRKDARAFYGIGNVYAELACSDDAIRAYSDALKLNKKFRDAIIGLGNEYANKDRLDEAEAQFRS
jgi:tetratricopeptide (TPR) repeat protein